MDAGLVAQEGLQSIVLLARRALGERVAVELCAQRSARGPGERLVGATDVAQQALALGDRHGLEALAAEQPTYRLGVRRATALLGQLLRQDRARAGRDARERLQDGALRGGRERLEAARAGHAHQGVAVLRGSRPLVVEGLASAAVHRTHRAQHRGLLRGRELPEVSAADQAVEGLRAVGGAAGACGGGIVVVEGALHLGREAREVAQEGALLLGAQAAEVRRARQVGQRAIAAGRARLGLDAASHGGIEVPVQRGVAHAPHVEGRHRLAVGAACAGEGAHAPEAGRERQVRALGARELVPVGVELLAGVGCAARVEDVGAHAQEGRARGGRIGEAAAGLGESAGEARGAQRGQGQRARAQVEPLAPRALVAEGVDGLPVLLAIVERLHAAEGLPGRGAAEHHRRQRAARAEQHRAARHHAAHEGRVVQPALHVLQRRVHRTRRVLRGDLDVRREVPVARVHHVTRWELVVLLPVVEGLVGAALVVDEAILTGGLILHAEQRQLHGARLIGRVLDRQDGDLRVGTTHGADGVRHRLHHGLGRLAAIV